MIMGLDEIKKYCSLHPNRPAMVIVDTCGRAKKDEKTPEETILRFGAWEKLMKEM